MCMCVCARACVCVCAKVTQKVKVLATYDQESGGLELLLLSLFTLGRYEVTWCAKCLWDINFQYWRRQFNC